MWSWFGGQSAQQKKDAPKKAILALRQQLEMLQKREKHLDNQMAEQDGIARKNVSSNKNAAKAALRRKKGYEHALEQTSSQIIQLEQQIYSIESANINQETLNAMKNAGQAMKQIHSGLTIDKVDETLDELRDQHALSQEIVNAITGANIGEPVDETELDEELEGMEQERIDEAMLKTGTVPVADEVNRLPEVGNKELRPTQVEDDEEAELAKLRAEMAM